MIKLAMTVDVDVLEAIADAAKTAPRRMNKAYKRRVKTIRQNVLDELRETPGKPRYPLRWKSDKQRKFVMAKLRREKNLPYQRTGMLEAGWTTEILDQKDGAIFQVQNRLPFARFVQGDDAQPFHLDTGWPQAADIVSKWREKATDLLIETWGLVAFGDE
jgi:hypothetical protein